ncbi:MAG: SprT-like domain-containing protein [Bacteroidetes bacterium]|nr:SprT-like domain-containing protein [Bacteroidota bacterium]
MSKKEAPLSYLQKFLPERSGQLVLDYLHQYKIHLTITRERKTILGDYRHATDFEHHRISINGNLNKYAFLITLIHELGHLVTFMQYGNRVQSHGKEWKYAYRKILEHFIALNIFPEDILLAFQKSIHNLPASSCADEDLMRILRRYDANIEGLLLVEQISEGRLFSIDNGKIFKKGKKIRKRFQCEEISTGKVYLFSPIYEVKAV